MSLKVLAIAGASIGGKPSKPPTNNTSKTPSKSNNPQNISGVDSGKVSTGTVVINKSDGTKETIKDAPLYNGAFYHPSTGNIMGDTHGPSGVYSSNSWDKDYYRDSSGTATGVFTEKVNAPTPSKPSKPSKGSSSSSSSSSRNDYYEPPPPPPPRPSKIEWNEPFPTFSSNYQTIKRYVYHLGIDEAIFSSVTHEENSVCVTPIIEVGNLGTEEYLMLEANFKGNVEFYILDGDKTIDILPVNQTRIEDEKMFFGLPLRFIVDTQYDTLVKRNNVVIDESYETILNNKNYWVSGANYSVTYVPIPQNTYRPAESRIQLKMIMRGISSISHLALRYYGENYYIQQRY